MGIGGQAAVEEQGNAHRGRDQPGRRVNASSGRQPTLAVPRRLTAVVRRNPHRGLYLVKEPERPDFIVSENILDRDMKNAVARLERQGDETKERFRREHRQESWFAAWDATEPETAAAGRRRGIDNRTAP